VRSSAIDHLQEFGFQALLALSQPPVRTQQNQASRARCGSSCRCPVAHNHHPNLVPVSWCRPATWVLLMVCLLRIILAPAILVCIAVSGARTN